MKKSILILLLLLFLSLSAVLADGDTDFEKYDGVVEYYADYVPMIVTRKDAIYQEMGTAKAMLAGEEVDKSDWDQTKYENVHFAIWLIKEEERGMQPLQFVQDGVTYYYDKDRSPDNPWSSDPTKKEQSTVPIYIPMYRDAENMIHFYWERQWQMAERSDEIDYGKFITKDNVNDYVDPNTVNDIFARQLNVFNVSFVPMIILDNNRDELEKHPMYRQGKTYLDDRIDILLPNPNNLYGINGKMLSMDQQFIFLQNSTMAYRFTNKNGEIDKYFDEAFIENQTAFIGLDGHQESLKADVNTREYIENICITDDIVDGTVWQDIDETSLLSIYQWNSIDFTRSVSNGEIVEYP
jgi:hypothetical protein